VIGPSERALQGIPNLLRSLTAVAVISLFTLVIPNNLLGQAFVPLRGEGTISTGYQYMSVHEHLQGDGTKFLAGRIYSQSISAMVDYGVTDKLAASFSLPYIASMYKGFNAHNPATLAVPNDQKFLDDGTYHGALQDIGFGVRYNVALRPMAITPFIAVNIPSHDYVFYAHTAPGRKLRQLSLGASVGGQSEAFLPNSYFHLRYAYEITERTEVEGVSYGGNQSLLRGDFGYFLTPRISAKAIQLLQITHGGLDYPTDFPDRTSELWLHHDQIQRINFLEMGGGIDYALSRSTDLSLSALKTVWGRNGHSLRMGLSVAVTWYFPRGRAGAGAGADSSAQRAGQNPVVTHTH
jgi:hypothetical protein